MKTILTLFCLLSYCSLSYSQIPNASFENWTGGKPIEWECLNAGSNLYVIPDSNAFSGNLAARIQSAGSSSLPLFTKSSTGSLWFSIGSNTRPSYIEFDAITQLNGGDFLNFTAALKQGPNIVGVCNGVCFFSDSPTYVHYSVPVTYYSPGALPDSANISFKFLTGSCSLYNANVNQGTFAILDNLEFNFSTDISDANNPDVITAYPNPVSKELIIRSNITNESLRYSIIDITGKILQHNIYSEKIDVSTLERGMYFLQIEGSGIQSLIFIKE